MIAIAACPTASRSSTSRVRSRGYSDPGRIMIPAAIWLLAMAGAALGFPALCFLFGWSLLGRFARLDAEERFAASWGVGFAVLAVSQFVAFVVDFPDPRLQVVTIVAMLGFALWQ